MTIAAILAGPHIKRLISDASGSLVEIEPLQFIPLRHVGTPRPRDVTTEGPAFPSLRRAGGSL